ncbi:MAG: 5-(carboxyamino)imidazole ribonucleotide synthase [Pseudomonadota bacterium]
MTDEPLAPGAHIGILGAGQLGRMLALAANPLGFRCHVYSPTTGPAFDVCSEGMTAKYEDKAALAEFGKAVDIITYEFENIPVETVRFLEQFCPVRPTPKALEVSQDRLTEKRFLVSAGASVADFHAVDTPDDLERALDATDGAGVLKTRRFGYDGKGQIMINDRAAITASDALSELGNVPLILERLIDYRCEVSVIGVRALNGDVMCFDVAENVHENHILKTSTVPASLSDDAQKTAKDVAARILSDLDYVGAMGVEFFVVDRDGKTELLVNEIAPRVHNSGHWTMDACNHSQFEQHIRAIVGWPLGVGERHADAVMTNLLGDDINDWASHANTPRAHFHDYAKREARIGRKMGHVNLLSPRKDAP